MHASVIPMNRVGASVLQELMLIAHDRLLFYRFHLTQASRFFMIHFDYQATEKKPKVSRFFCQSELRRYELHYYGTGNTPSVLNNRGWIWLTNDASNGSQVVCSVGSGRDIYGFQSLHDWSSSHFKEESFTYFVVSNIGLKCLNYEGEIQIYYGTTFTGSQQCWRGLPKKATNRLKFLYQPLTYLHYFHFGSTNTLWRIY